MHVCLICCMYTLKLFFDLARTQATKAKRTNFHCLITPCHIVDGTGSRVDQLSSLIHKLLPHASGLLYTHGPPSSSSPSTPHHHLPRLPRITGVISNLGERLELQQVHSYICFYSLTFALCCEPSMMSCPGGRCSSEE